MKTPIAKRWPVPLAILVGIIVASAASHAIWIRLLVLATVLVTTVLILRFVVGWSWSNILLFRESE